MSIRIARHALMEIRRDCRRRAPEEACGLLLGGGDRIARAVAADNHADDRLRRFEINPAVLFAAHRAARRGAPAIVGCYHSHPAGLPVPSAADAAGAHDLGWIWLIAGAASESAFRVTANGPIHGRFDQCILSVEG